MTSEISAATSAVSAAGRRLGPDARRGQLVAAGLELVKTVPYPEVSADDVARAAGVSKALVFHYFPTTRDLHVAILRAAAAELLVRLDVDPKLPPDQKLRAGLEAFVAHIEQQPAGYLAVARSAGADEQLLAVFEDTRAGVVEIVGRSLGLTVVPPGLRIAIRGWIAMVEESVLHWLEDRPVPRHQLVDFLQKAALTMLPNALTLGQPLTRRGPGDS